VSHSGAFEAEKKRKERKEEKWIAKRARYLFLFYLFPFFFFFFSGPNDRSARGRKEEEIGPRLTDIFFNLQEQPSARADYLLSLFFLKTLCRSSNRRSANFRFTGRYGCASRLIRSRTRLGIPVFQQRYLLLFLALAKASKG